MTDDEFYRRILTAEIHSAQRQPFNFSRVAITACAAMTFVGLGCSIVLQVGRIAGWW